MRYGHGASRQHNKYCISAGMDAVKKCSATPGQAECQYQHSA
jgi:hypothetical protein